MPENSTPPTLRGPSLKRGGGGDRSGFAGSGALAGLRREIRGAVHTDALTLGLYSTDASIYQVRPVAVVLPRSVEDIAATLAVAQREGIPVTPRGAGTSQGGQAIGAGIVVDTSVSLQTLKSVDPGARTAVVEPGLVLDRLNREIEHLDLFFPVDVATSSRATLGGMAGNNSAGARSIRYGLMSDNVRSIEALLADGSSADFGGTGRASTVEPELERTLRGIRTREADELERRVPKVLRHVAGYGLHRVGEDGSSLADLLVGSEGTLAFFTSLELSLARCPNHRTLAVCHFADLHSALAAVAGIVELDPSAVELTDATLIGLAREHPGFASRVETFVIGDPGALLFVEFEGDDHARLLSSLDALESHPAVQPGPVFRADTPELQAEVWAVRKAGMNILMSGRGPRKPVSIIEDCAIPLDRLAEWGDRLQRIFARHGVKGTWYAHASVGCLHVRPSLDLKSEPDIGLLRTIAEETHELVRELGGSHSGEHGDGRIRSEFIEPMLGPRLAGAFAEIKTAFDPKGVLNPGIIVDPAPMDDRTSFRYGNEYGALPMVPALDWSADGGLLVAIERCNNNGACRKQGPGLMCPSYRATRQEIDTPRGRANTLRLALTGQLGTAGLASDEVHEALDLCVGCKACRVECPVGVDVSRLKTEALAQRNKETGIASRTRLFANLPRTAPRIGRFARLLNSAAASGAGRRLRARLGIEPSRPLPQWALRPFRDSESSPAGNQTDVLLFADTFNRWFEPENLRAALRVLDRVGVRVGTASLGSRPLCCGRTYLSAGMTDQALIEMSRTAAVLLPFIERGGVVVGLEPSCILTFRDEAHALLPKDQADLLARGTLLLGEFLERQDRVRGELRRPRTVRVHGHCHEKAFGVHSSVPTVLGQIEGADVQPIVSGCCGMAGSFGYEKEHFSVSRTMSELDLLPALTSTPPDATIVADGFSCRHQIADLAEKRAIHAVILLDEAWAQHS